MFVPFLVKLVADDLYIGSGRVTSLFVSNRRVHNIEMDQDEVIIELKKVDIRTHPIHNYELEVGSFTAWKLKDLEIIN